MATKAKIGVLGASGYTGADAVRLLARHPNVEIAALTANTYAGKTMNEVFPHFFMLDLRGSRRERSIGARSMRSIAAAARHHAGDHAAVLAASPAIKILDMSADFRLRDMGITRNGTVKSIAPAAPGERLWTDEFIARRSAPRGSSPARLLPDRGAPFARADRQGRLDAR